MSDSEDLLSDSEKLKQFNDGVVAEFRANNGSALGGSPVLLLNHTGGRSGALYVTPLVYTRDADNYVIIASKGGVPTNPHWFLNLIAKPDVVIEVGDKIIPVRARVTEGDERSRLFAAQAALMPNFADYAQATTREIPVVVLEQR